ncbi:MAG: hypothetical protein RBR96_05530 [Candidatus Izemoplasmatales bacterium]|jgi:hypothetical protein|nr:hypothetical protein [Candidatus Izemoplasmatales bacterium]
MKLRFQRVKSFIGFSLLMKVIIDGEIVYKLKNGEVFEFEKDKIDSIVIKTHRFVFDLEIPVDKIKESADILLDYQLGICRNTTQAIVSENGQLIGVYPQKENAKEEKKKD